jgi:hypothetical protein
MAQDVRELSIEELDKSIGGMAVTIEKVTAAVEVAGTGGILSGSAMGAVVKAVIAAISAPPILSVIQERSPPARTGRAS